MPANTEVELFLRTQFLVKFVLYFKAKFGCIVMTPNENCSLSLRGHGQIQ